MRRRLLNLVTALSAVLCVAALVMWVRGTAVVDGMRWKRVVPLQSPMITEDTFYVVFGGGAVRVCHCNVLQNYGEKPLRAVRFNSRPIEQLPRGFRMFETVTLSRPILGFAYAEGRGPGRMKGGRLVAVPYWFLVLASGAGPALRARATLRRAYRRRAGRCVACGYDVRASTAACPECGATLAPPAPAAAGGA
jgi:hypothetical protein